MPGALDAPAEQTDKALAPRGADYVSSRVHVTAGPIGEPSPPVIDGHVLGHRASDATIRRKSIGDETRGRIDQFPHSVADLDR